MAAVLAATVALGSTAGGCGDDDGRVVIDFDPAVGTESSSTGPRSTPRPPPTSRAADTPSRSDHATIDARHEVLSSDGAGVRVEVELSRRGTGTRTFVIRFDRAAQLTAVEEVEGIPAEALGDLGLTGAVPGCGRSATRAAAGAGRSLDDQRLRCSWKGMPRRDLVGEGSLASSASSTATTPPRSTSTTRLDGPHHARRPPAAAARSTVSSAATWRRSTTSTRERCAGSTAETVGRVPGGAGATAGRRRRSRARARSSVELRSTVTRAVDPGG